MKTLLAIYFYFKEDNKKLDFIKDLFLAELLIFLAVMLIVGIVYAIKFLL